MRIPEEREFCFSFQNFRKPFISFFILLPIQFKSMRLSIVSVVVVLVAWKGKCAKGMQVFCKKYYPQGWRFFVKPKAWTCGPRHTDYLCHQWKPPTDNKHTLMRWPEKENTQIENAKRLLEEYSANISETPFAWAGKNKCSDRNETRWNKAATLVRSAAGYWM